MFKSFHHFSDIKQNKNWEQSKLKSMTQQTHMFASIVHNEPDSSSSSALL